MGPNVINKAEAPILAVDLDSTLIDPLTEKPFSGAKEALLEFKHRGWKIIIFTVRDDAKDVARILRSNGIPYDTINQNIPGVGSKSPKVYYDVLIDDRAISFDGNWANKVAEAERKRIQLAGDKGQRIVVKRLNPRTQISEIIAEIALDKEENYGIIKKSKAFDMLCKDVLCLEDNYSGEDLIETLLRLNGSRLWCEIKKRRSFC